MSLKLHRRWLLHRRRSLFASLLLVFTGLMTAGCGATIYQNQEFGSITSAHKQVAVLPFKVTFAKIPKDVTPEAALKLEKNEAAQFQRALYGALLQRQGKGEYTVQFQDIDRTNAVLTQANIDYDNIGAQTKDSLAKMLSVDAVMSGNIRRSQPMSTGTAVALGLLVGVWGSTNRVDVDLAIHNGADGRLLWTYTWQASGSVGSSPEALAQRLMKNASKKFPYQKPKS